MALIGIYVGVIPVAIGMLWLPWVRGVDARWMRFLLAFTIGLLAFLGVDALLEGTELAGSGPGSFGGAALVWLGAAGAYLALAGVDGWLARVAARARRRRGPRAAVGPARAASATAPPSWSRSASACTTWARGSRSAPPTRSARSRSAPTLVVGFALHNTTEGLAIVAPVAREGKRRGWSGCCCSACWPARPAVLGAWIGASAFHPSLAALMFGIGAGAIAQVIVQIAPQVRDESGRFLHPLAPRGLLAGLLVMYVTGLLVSV